jgi:hypothetical protein
MLSVVVLLPDEQAKRRRILIMPIYRRKRLKNKKGPFVGKDL